METPTLIYCAGKNPKFDAIAQKTGFKLGIQLPYSTVTHPPYFVDQNWKDPDRVGYMQALERYRPMMATVLDFEEYSQLSEVLSCAEEAAQYVKIVIIIPKVFGGISQLPKRIGDTQVVLGYSVPTRFGGTSVPLWEFTGWPVHLLGGSPTKQYRLSKYLHVVSVDGNYANLCATKFCKWFDGRGWHQLTKDGDLWGQDAPYECFRRSCQGIQRMWQQDNNAFAADAIPRPLVSASQ